MDLFFFKTGFTDDTISALEVELRKTYYIINAIYVDLSVDAAYVCRNSRFLS